MLALRPNCELCDVDLPPASPDARICTYECTFCASCVEGVLHNVCPNCGGGFVARPIRPQRAWREGADLASNPPDTVRRHTSYTEADLAEFVAGVRHVPPAQR
jgi:uncharacterized protein